MASKNKSIFEAVDFYGAVRFFEAVVIKLEKKLQITGNVEIQGNLSVAGDVPDSRPYKVYLALISQSGTNAPTATVLENTLGGTVVWTRSDTGQYVATLASAFTANKTIVSLNKNISGSADEGINAFVRFHIASVNAINLFTGTSDGGLIDISSVDLRDLSIEIRVYP